MSLVLIGFNGVTPLHKATMRADLALMEFMLKSGADVNAINNFGESPLLFAAKRGSPVVNNLLLPGSYFARFYCNLTLLPGTIN